jgi:hypothetical protein
MLDLCNDPRCLTCGDYATSLRNGIPRDVIVSPLCNDGHVDVMTETAHTITGKLWAETLSCTGPVLLHFQFSRDLLQNLHIDDELVTVTLAEPVL